MDVLIAKVLSLLGILMFSIIFGIAPIYLEKFIRSPKVRWVNNAIICFSGGTLLGISFLHLMPEMRESYYGLKNHGYFSEVPSQISVVDTIICAGFFLIYIMDELIHLLLERLGGDSSHQVITISGESVLEKEGISLFVLKTPSFKNGEYEPHGWNLSSGAVSTSYSTKSELSKKDEATNTGDAEMGIPLPHPHTIHIPGILTIVALSFHDIFEGLALGIQDHDLDVLFLFVSVATHKYAIAFAVSLDFLLSGVNTKMIVMYTVCFSLVNPVGIGLGIISHLISDQEEGNIDSVMTVIMQGISSGSLIYVTCFEVLQRHGSGEGGHLHGIRNTLFVILGYCFVLVLKVVLPHHHSHSY